MKTKTRGLAALAASLFAAIALAAGPETRMEAYHGNGHDNASLQRGAKVFVNYCLNCHSAQYMRYNRLTDIGLTEDQIRDNLVFTGAKVGDLMVSALKPADAKVFFKGPVPDLSVETRVRGAEWVYNYLLGFYRSDGAPTGWDNLVFPGVSMPHALWEAGGVQKLVQSEHKTHDDAKGAMLAAPSVATIEHLASGKYLLKTVAVEAPGAVSSVEYRAMVTDLVNFLEFVAEPSRNTRTSIGVVTLVFLTLLLLVAYWLKKEYWKDVR